MKQIIWVFLGVLIGASSVLGDEKLKSWQAGVAKVVITPKQPMWMSGYANRNKPAEGKVHDLWAKALVIQDANGKKCVIVTADLVGINRKLSKSVCDRLQAKYGFDRDGIMIAVSHTHCGPVVGGNLSTMYFLDEGQQKRVDDYAKELQSNLVKVVGVALKDLSPAELSWGNGLVTFATNRRTNREAQVPELRKVGKLKGPRDHQVPVLAVRDLKGHLRSVVFGYACHATTLSFYQWCGDYPGFAQVALEKEYPKAVAMFWAGCGGDQNPLPRRSLALAKKYGDELAEGVSAVLRAPMRQVPPCLRMSYQEIDLRLAELPSREVLARDLLSKNRFVRSRGKFLLEKLTIQGNLPKSYPYPIQTWQLGSDLTWVALGGEVVVDYSLRLRRELGPCWVAGYANDVMAYIPSLRVLKEGGYEGGGAMVYYGMPGVWSPEVESQIVDAVTMQVKGLRRTMSPKKKRGL